MPDPSPPETASHRRWLHVLPHLDPAFGGLSSAVPELVSALNRTDLCTADIAAFCSPEETWPSLPADVTAQRWPLSRSTWLRDSSLRIRFHQHLTGFDGVHIHGLWEQSTLLTARIARTLGKPYVLSAHGMLDPWALHNKRLKKALYAAAVERRNVRGAAALHALTTAEVDDYRRFLRIPGSPPIAVIPNGVTIPAKLDPQHFFRQFPELQNRRLILFLGRIHYKKGVDTLIRAWSRLAAAHPNAHLVLAGPDFEGTRARAEALVNQLTLNTRVTFTGMLRGHLKWSALAAAGVFVLPSLSEGFSVSVLEAMGTGLPVVVTHDCHLPEISETQAGWITQSKTEPLASSLENYLLNSAQSNQNIGARGRKLVEQKFSWSAIAKTMATLYTTL